MKQQLIFNNFGAKGSKYRGFLCLIALGTAVYYFLPVGIRWPAENIKNLSEHGYLVSSPHCQIPDINPFHPSIVEFFEPEVGPIDCGDQLALTYTERHENRVRLRIVYNSTRRYGRNNFTCCYSVVVRQTDLANKVSACVKFDDGTVLDPDVQHLSVTCEYENAVIYKNVHPIVQDRVVRPPSEHLTSVVLVGVDSMSRLSLMRSMPLTVELLSSLGWVEMTGYNKVADNTLPNVMAFLSGLNESQAEDINCVPPASSGHSFDHCPFVWKDFKRRGYMTAHAEDEAGHTTFNYDSQGFIHQPTDFYLHPSMVEAHNTLTLRQIYTLAVCLGETRTTDVVLKYTLDLLETYPVGLFEFVWLTNFSHDDDNLPAAADVTLAEFFRKVATMPAYESTIFVFLSDHGMRYGQIRETDVGWFEERLPFLYIHVPPQFREQHPKAFENLVGNSRRLTSPFDLHLTLKDVVEGDYGRRLEGSRGCPTCVSLFDQVPNDRSCAEAGIPAHFCTCLSDTEVLTTSRNVKEAADSAVENVNKLLEQANIKARKNAAESRNSSMKSMLNFGANDKLKMANSKGDTRANVHEASEANGKYNISQTKASNITGDRNKLKAEAHITVAIRNEKLVGKISAEGKIFAKEIVTNPMAEDPRIPQCAKLRVSEVVRARFVDKADVGGNFRVAFIVEPGRAVMDATVHRREETASYETLGTVSRIDKMRGEACSWVTDKKLQLYCYCVYEVFD